MQFFTHPTSNQVHVGARDGSHLTTMVWIGGEDGAQISVGKEEAGDGWGRSFRLVVVIAALNPMFFQLSHTLL